MDEIIDSLARECAAALVSLRGCEWPMLYLAEYDNGPVSTDGQFADVWLAERRADFAQTIAAALRRLRDAMNAGPLPPAVPAEELAYMRDCPESSLMLRRALAHVDHLERLVRLLAQESEGLAFAAGLAQGKRLGRADGAIEQRKACADAALAATQPTIADWDHARRVIARAVESVPLVTDPEGAP